MTRQPVRHRPAGSITFTVENTGSQTTEFYVYEQDGTTIVGEVENIGPGLSRDLTVDLTEGTYVGRRLQAGHDRRRHSHRLRRHVRRR